MRPSCSHVHQDLHLMSNGLADWSRMIKYKWGERIQSGEGKCSLTRDLQDWKRSSRAAKAWRNQQERAYDLLHPTEPPEHGGFGDQQLALSPPQHSTTWNLLEPEGSANLAFKISAHVCQQSTPHIIFYFLFSIISDSYSCVCLLAVLSLLVDCLVRFRDHCSGFSSGSLPGSLYVSDTSRICPRLLSYTVFFFLSVSSPSSFYFLIVTYIHLNIKHLWYLNSTPNFPFPGILPTSMLFSFFFKQDLVLNSYPRPPHPPTLKLS